MATSLASAPKTAAGKGGKDDAVAPAPAKSKKKLLLVVVAVVVVVGAAAWFFLLKPSGPSTPAAPEPGIVVKLDPISVNLAGGHFLKVGVALQGTAAAKELEGSKALDLTISEFSGRRMEELAKPKEREKVKKELTEKIAKAYDEEVMAIYFTDFVTQ